MNFNLVSIAVALGLFVAVVDSDQSAEQHSILKPIVQKFEARVDKLFKRSDNSSKHKDMMHSHLSRKVFDRACAASKDTIDEIIACLTTNDFLMKHIKIDVASSCYKSSFNMEFDTKDMDKHKEMICKNREKFEDMTACIYRKTAEASDSSQMDKFAEAMVDVGLCIINALDG